MHLKELKSKNPADLVSMAEELGVEGASTLRKQDLMFAILKELAEDGEQIMGLGTIEVLPDSFGFLRSPEANYLAGPDDIYVSPNMVRQFGLRTGDTVDVVVARIHQMHPRGTAHALRACVCNTTSRRRMESSWVAGCTSTGTSTGMDVP